MGSRGRQLPQLTGRVDGSFGETAIADKAPLKNEKKIPEILFMGVPVFLFSIA